VRKGPEGFRTRENYLKEIFGDDHLGKIREDEKAAYCTTSLTNTPIDLQPILEGRQGFLRKEILRKADISSYDPANAPSSPHVNVDVEIDDIYRKENSNLIAERRFFTGHNIVPSSGYGVEVEMAKKYNRISVIFMDSSIRVSTMQPNRTIYLEYGNLQEQKKDFIDVFNMLQEYDPGMGINTEIDRPVLLGFHKMTGKTVDLEEKVYKEFPLLQYKYDHKIPILILREENPKVFYEFKSLK